MSKGFSDLRSGGSASLLPEFKKRWAKINAGLWMKIPGTPTAVYRVRAQFIRGFGTEYPPIYQDFCLGGNPEAYAWVPEDMIIIESTLVPYEQWATVIHELAEMIAIARDHIPYNKAHTNRANKAEREYRDHPERRIVIWSDLTRQYREMLVRDKGKDDRIGT